MKLFAEREKNRRLGGKRICALLLTLVLLLELSGAVPSLLVSPITTRASAAESFTYQPGFLNAALLPKNDVLPLSKVQELEARNPSLVLNVNSKFGLNDRAYQYTAGSKNIGDKLYANGDWTVRYVWNPNDESPEIKDHLLNEAMDLELFWSGSYTRTDSANPTVELWYYGNTDHNEYKSPFTEKREKTFNYGDAGSAHTGSTGAVPLSYNELFDGYTWTILRDEHGRWRYRSDGEPYWVNEYWRKDVKAVVGQRSQIKPGDDVASYTWSDIIEDVVNNHVYIHKVNEKTPMNLRISGGGGSSISDTKMRLRDNAAPFLNNITLKKNGNEITDSDINHYSVQNADGSYTVKQEVHMKNTDKLDVVLEFNEKIRFADNDGTNNHGLKLRLTFVDTSNGTSDSDSWVDADLISISGKTMTFRFDQLNSLSGKTLPAEFYVDGLTGSAQSGWFSNEGSFPLSLVDANGHTVSTGALCCGIITDLAGNPFEYFNVTRFDADYKVMYDALAPHIYKTSLWTSNFSEAESSTELNQNEIEPAKLYLKEGDQVNLKVVFSEEMYSANNRLLDSSGNELGSAATLNITQNGSAVTLPSKRISTIDSKSIDVNAARRRLTVIEYQPLTITDGMTVNGDSIMVTAIGDLDRVCDLALNTIVNTTIPQIPHQQRIDTTPPTVAVGTTVDDTLDPDVFTVPITVIDDGSGVEKVQVRLVHYTGNGNDYLWTVDTNATIVHRENDLKTVDTSGWTLSASHPDSWNRPDANEVHWQTLTLPAEATQMYLHVKLLNTNERNQWGYWLSDATGETDGTRKTVTQTNLQVRAWDIKGHKTGEETGKIAHGVGHKTETVITFGGFNYEPGVATVQVTVTNPMGVQKIVWGNSENTMTNTVYTGDLTESYTFNIAQDIGTSASGEITLFVGAYGPTGAAKVNSTYSSYKYEAGKLSYDKNLGDDKEPLFGLPVITNMSVTDDNRTMVLIDKGDGTFFATAELNYSGHNLFDTSMGSQGYVKWYLLTGTAASDYSSLTVTERTETSAPVVKEWLEQYYGKVTMVLLNQNKNISVSENGYVWGQTVPNSEWNYDDTLPGSYDAANEATAYTVEFAYLANGPTFAVTTGVVYSDATNTAVPADVLSGKPSEPHSDLSDYTFTVGLANIGEANANQTYGLRIVQSMEAELFRSNDGTNYESVRTVDLSVGSNTNLRFTKGDSQDENGEASGWYKVVFRYTVNGVETETTVAEGVYLDNTSSIEPDIVSYNRSFDVYVREPHWKYSAYFIVDDSHYTHTSAAADSDIEDGEIVKIGVAPIKVPEDIMPDGNTWWSPYLSADAPQTHNDPALINRYYVADNEVNELKFSFAQTDPKAGAASLSRIGGTNYFYAWSGNDPNGRASAAANKQTFTVGSDITLTVTDSANGFDYTDGKLPLTDGYNLVHYVVEYEDGETVEKSFMTDVRAKAMDLGLDIYYHEKDRYIDEATLEAAWNAVKDLEDKEGNKIYTDDDEEDYKQEYLAHLVTLGAVETTVTRYETDEKGNVSDTPTTGTCYVIAGAKCTDEADLYHRNEAVVNPVLNDYDASIASSFMSYSHLDGYGLSTRTDPVNPKPNPMGDERFAASTEHELFFAEDIYGNVSFAAAEMDAIDGEAPEITVSSAFEKYNLGDIVRSTGDAYNGYDFLLGIKDDHAMDLANLTVSFDPAYSQVLDPKLDGEKEQVTMKLPLNTEQDELGFFVPWTLSESEAGTTGGITMTCLKMDTSANHDSPEYKTINGVEIQGAFKPCDLDNNIVMTFTLTDAYGNTTSEDVVFANNNGGYRVMSEDFGLTAGVNDNLGWYEGYVERDADGNTIDRWYPGFNELPDWAPEPVYYRYEYDEDDERYDELNGKANQIDPAWISTVADLLPEVGHPDGAGKYFTNDGYVKVGIVSKSQVGVEYASALPYAISVESYQTDYGVFTDGYVRTRTFEKVTGRYAEGTRPWTEQAIILPSVTQNGEVTVNWTDIFGEKHENTVNITAFGTSSDSEMTVRATFSPLTRTNEDVVVTLKGSRVKNGEDTSTSEITGITVTPHDANGVSFDENDSRVSIYASQPWNATVLVTENSTIKVDYKYPGNYQYYDNELDDWVISDYVPASRTFVVTTIDKTPPTPTVSYVYADTGEAVGDGVTSTTREIRAIVTADEPIEGVDGGLSRVFTYGTAADDTLTFTVRDKAGNTVDVTAVCPATINTPAASGENAPPTATVYLSANLGGVSRSIGVFNLSEDGDTAVTIIEDGNETTTTVNLNNEAVSDINAAIAANIAHFYTLRFEISDENPAACTVISSDNTVADVGANNTATVRTNGTFNLTVSDSQNSTSSLTGITVSSIDTEPPTVTPVYGLYTAMDGTPRVRVAFKTEDDEQIYPIVTGDQTSRDIRSTIYNIYDTDGETVLGQRTGFFTDFARNEDYTFYYKDVYGNASSVSVKVRGIDTDAPAFTSIRWNGTVNNMTPDTEGAGPTGRNVNAVINTDKALSSVEMYYFDENAENNVGAALSAEDAGKVSLNYSANVIEVTWTDNVDSRLILAAKSATSGLTSYHELPVINVIDKTVPTVTLDSSVLAEDKASKEFRFTVSGAAGEVFTSNLAAAYTSATNADGEETVTKYAIGVKGTQFIYIAANNLPVTLKFTDDAGNSTEYTLTAAMLADVDSRNVAVLYNTVGADEGATMNLSDLTISGSTLYVYPNKNITVTLIDDHNTDPDAEPDPSKVWNVSARTWAPITVSATANIQMLKLSDQITGRYTIAWLVSDADRVPPAISYTGGDTVFANTEMTTAEIEALALEDVSAYDGVDGAIDRATITATVIGDPTVAGLHTVKYAASDSSGNEATIERNLYIKGKYDPIIKVNGSDTVPLGTTVLKTRNITLTGSCALNGDNSVYIAIRPGIMTAARMKYTTASGTNSLSYTAPTDGYYTVLARNRDRTEVLTYIYVDYVDTSN